MTDKEAKKQWRKLKDMIEHHRNLYYLDQQPEISDEEYDALERELIAIEKEFPELNKNSPTQKVGGAPAVGFKKIKHKVAQWSFNDVFDENELIEFDKKLKELLLLSMMMWMLNILVN